MGSWLTLCLILFLSLPSAAQGSEEACRTCHPDVKIEHDAGVHGRRFGCTACHGGDPDALEIEDAHATDRGYLGTPERIDVPPLCASCHADPTHMKPYGLPTDQYAQYQTSEHGLRLAQGDTRVAICTDCHGVHRILGRDEPTSPEARLNISTTCGRCHSNPEIMGPYDLPTTQVEEFRHSAHGEALFVQNHPSAPTCATCHGAHGAVAPEAGSITAVCGHCHTRTRKYFNKGPHGKATADGVMSECTSCHGYHDGAAANRVLLDSTCTRCHTEDSKEIAVANKFKTLLGRAEESMESAAQEIDRVQRTFPTVARQRPRLQQAHAHLMEALPQLHALSVEGVEDHTRHARFIAEEVRAAVHGVEEHARIRYIGLAFVWIFIFFASGVAYLLKREIHREGND